MIILLLYRMYLLFRLVGSSSLSGVVHMWGDACSHGMSPWPVLRTLGLCFSCLALSCRPPLNGKVGHPLIDKHYRISFLAIGK